MAISSEEREGVVKQYQKHVKDSGSARVQVALITSRLNDLQSHFEKHKADHHSRRGLMKLVGRRRRLLDYLKRTNINEYRELIEQLGIRK